MMSHEELHFDRNDWCCKLFKYCCQIVCSLFLNKLMVPNVCHCCCEHIMFTGLYHSLHLLGHVVHFVCTVSHVNV